MIEPVVYLLLAFDWHDQILWLWPSHWTNYISLRPQGWFFNCGRWTWRVALRWRTESDELSLHVRFRGLLTCSEGLRWNLCGRDREHQLSYKAVSLNSDHLFQEDTIGHQWDAIFLGANTGGTKQNLMQGYWGINIHLPLRQGVGECVYVVWQHSLQYMCVNVFARSAFMWLGITIT